MRAIITPLGMPARTFELIDEPTWSDRELGGWGDATMSIPDMDDHTRSRLHRATVELQDGESVYFGKVERWDGPTITAKGWHDAVMDGKPRSAWYAHNTAADWREHGSSLRNKRISVDIESTGFRMVWQDDETYAANAYQACALFVPPCDRIDITFTVERSSSVYEWSLEYGQDADTDLGVAYTQVVSYGTYGTGTRTVTLTGTDITAVRFVCKNNASRTPSSNEYLRVKAITTYCAGTTSPTPDFVVGDALDQLDSEDVPSREIGVDNSNTLVPLIFDPDTTESTKIERVLDYTEAQFRWEKRLVGALYRPAAIFRTPPTTPRYTFDAYAPEVQATLTGGDVSTVVTNVRVLYADKLGRTRWVEVTAPDTNPLKRVGGTRWATITADTTSATVATTAGETYLALYGVPQVRGTIEVTAPHKGVTPSTLEAGQLATITNTEYGTVTARIKQVDHTGGNRAVLTLDNTPTLDDLLTRKARAARAAGGRFAWVGYIDRRRAG